MARVLTRAQESGGPVDSRADAEARAEARLLARLAPHGKEAADPDFGARGKAGKKRSGWALTEKEMEYGPGTGKGPT